MGIRFVLIFTSKEMCPHAQGHSGTTLRPWPYHSCTPAVSPLGIPAAGGCGVGRAYHRDPGSLSLENLENMSLE